MDTIKKNQSKAENKKGGRNEFSKLLIAGGGLVVGSIGGVIAGGNILKPEAEPQPMPEPMQDETNDVNVAEEHAGKEETQTVAQETQNAGGATDEPTPIDSYNGSNNTNATTNVSQNGNGETNEEHVDEIAQRIAESSEIDNGDSTSAFMQIGEPVTMYDMNGNSVNTFAVTFNDPNLAGQQFILADTDGDGVYDGLYTADGQQFSLTFANVDGTETSFEELLANAHLEYADLEEMQHDDGSFMGRNDLDNSPMNEELIAQDIISNDEELDQQELLAQLLNEAEDDSDDIALLEEKEYVDGWSPSQEEDDDTQEINDEAEHDEYES